MFWYRERKRSSFLPFVIFRLLLSLTIFLCLLTGLYLAYKQFSGVDPLKINPASLISNLTNSREDLEKLKSLLPKKVQENAGQVAGEEVSSQPNPASSRKPLLLKKALFNFLLVADSHSENSYLQKALNLGKEREAKFVIGLGDYTEVGTVAELEKVKKEFDNAGLRYFLAVGDHDLWDARDKQKEPTVNFIEVFGSPYQSFIYNDIKFIILYNSDNYLGLGEGQWNWLKNQLEREEQENIKKVYVFLHKPLYHPSSTHVMGMVTEGLKGEAKNLARLLKEKGVAEIFAGDIHFFSRYEDPENKLAMTTIGALASNRNPQAPKFTIITVFDDLSLGVEDIEIKN